PFFSPLTPPFLLSPLQFSIRGLCFLFLFIGTATTEIYTLSLHDALPICTGAVRMRAFEGPEEFLLSLRSAQVLRRPRSLVYLQSDRKSTRLNSSHQIISYAVFCLKKKNKLRILRSKSEHQHIAGLHVCDS